MATRKTHKFKKKVRAAQADYIKVASTGNAATVSHSEQVEGYPGVRLVKSYTHGHTNKGSRPWAITVKGADVKARFVTTKSGTKRKWSTKEQALEYIHSNLTPPAIVKPLKADDLEKVVWSGKPVDAKPFAPWTDGINRKPKKTKGSKKTKHFNKKRAKRALRYATAEWRGPYTA